MDKRPTASPPPSPSLLGKWPWLGVVLVLLLVGFIRYRVVDMPLERDEGEYAYAGQLLLQGIPPYQLAWNMKLPGTYFAYALGMGIFGQDSAGIHEALIIVSSLTIICVFMLTRKLFGRVAGLGACATFGILSVSPAVMGMAAHANHFVILFALWATLLLWSGEEFYRWYVYFFSGILYGLAFLMKQQGICFCVFAATFVLGNAIVNRAVFSTVFYRKVFYLGLGMILPLAVTYKYLDMAGVLAKCEFWTGTYAMSYATEVTPREGLGKFFDYAGKKWPIYFAFFGFILISLPFILRDRTHRNKILFAGWFLLFSFIGTAIDLNFREHYFLLLLPALAVFVGLAISTLQFAIESRFFKIFPALICLLILGWVVYFQRDFYFNLPAPAVSRIIYAGDTPFTDMPQIGDYIRTNSAPSATVAVIGSEPEIYFYAQRHSATGYMYMYPLMERQPFASEMQHEMISEIETNQPQFLVFVRNADSWNAQFLSDPTIFKWFPGYAATNYVPSAALNQMPQDATQFVVGTNSLTATNTIVAIYIRKQ